MYTAGITAEFNPFHKGHAYLISEARRRGATHIAVVMSGAAVQRGELAVCPKQERAAAAIKNGADLVVELPAPYSCSAAHWFADYAVQILVQLGIDALAFGSEYENAELLLAAANVSSSKEVGRKTRELTSLGLPYPAALARSAEELYGGDVAKILSSPNSTLAVEYISALKKSGSTAEIMPIARSGAGHDMPPEDGLASGSYLREKLLDGADCSEYIPEGCSPETLCDGAAAEKVIYYSLLTADRQCLLRLPEVNDLLADRILNAAKAPPKSLSEFLLSVKARGFTLARIRRSSLHLALGITSDDLLPVPYIRILACNTKGTEILKRAAPSVPISASLKKLETSSPNAARISAIEQNAVKLMQLCTGRFENEYERKFSVSE